jgi:HrpA-like RNA helicase
MVKTGFIADILQVDEVHERSVYTDLLLGMLKK